MNEQVENHQAPQGHPHAEAAKPEAEASAVEHDAASSSAAAVVQKWVGDCIQNSPVARSTEGYNHLTTVAIPELLRRLAAE